MDLSKVIFVSALAHIDGRRMTHGIGKAFINYRQIDPQLYLPGLDRAVICSLEDGDVEKAPPRLRGAFIVRFMYGSVGAAQ